MQGIKYRYKVEKTSKSKRSIFQVELRDHDHTVECIAWAGENSSQAINEAAGTDNKTGSHHGPFLASGSRDKSIRV